MHFRVGVTLAHVIAAVRARKVHAVAFGWRDELADFLDTLRRQPAFTAATLHGKAIRRLFVGSAKLMSALVRVNPHFDGYRNLGHQPRVENQKPGVCSAKIIELAIQHRGPLAARQLTPVKYQLSGRHEPRIAAYVSDVFFRCRWFICARHRRSGDGQQGAKRREQSLFRST